MIILIGGEKGGSGKSCLAQNLAVYLQKQSKDVLIFDADPQGTTIDWANERSQNSKLVHIESIEASGNIRQRILDLSKRYETIIIDAGGQDSEALRSAMTVATHMLLPFRPKRRDLKTLTTVEQLINLAVSVNPELFVRAVITQCPALPNQYYRIDEAKQTCDSFGIQVLNSTTISRNIYDDADEGGLSVLEIDNSNKASQEINNIAKEFLGI